MCKRTRKVLWLVSGLAIVVCVVALGMLIRLAGRAGWDPQKMGSLPQAFATLIGAMFLVIGWSVSNYQSIERDILTKKERIDNHS